MDVSSSLEASAGACDDYLLETIKPGQAPYHASVLQPVMSMFTDTEVFERAISGVHATKCTFICRQTRDVCGH